MYKRAYSQPRDALVWWPHCNQQVTQALEVCETELKALHESYVEMLAAYEVASSGILPSGYVPTHS
jgi:hypothetical protein